MYEFQSIHIIFALAIFVVGYIAGNFTPVEEIPESESKSIDIRGVIYSDLGDTFTEGDAQEVIDHLIEAIEESNCSFSGSWVVVDDIIEKE